MQFHEAKTYICGRLRAELPDKYSYHSVAHILDVYRAAEALGQAEGVGPEEMELLLTAALYHDCGFMIQAKDHEEIGCTIAAQSLPQFAYSPAQIDQVCGMIRATRIPQSPQNHLEEILADADLDYLGRDDFWSISNKLFLELKSSQVVQTLEEWNQLQLKFFGQHHYFTQTALKTRQAGKEAHAAMLRNMVHT